MAATKTKVQYVCTQCGSIQMKWLGKCPDCGEWNTLEEEVVRQEVKTRSDKRGGSWGGAGALLQVHGI